ncbi:MAG: hypothetical protein KGJ02_01330 [Verrucomicrobiota bacterium]|nr:hypothetical protein [Verrucomicrobiota bacterium]
MLRSILFIFFMTSSLLARDVKICLLMTVDDTENFIWECSRSVSEFIDAACLINNEPTNKKDHVIEDFFKDSPIPGLILKQKKGTAIIHAAKEFLEDNDFSLEDTYFLLLDADMTLKRAEGFQKNALDADSYLILQKSHSRTCSIYEARLLRASLPWELIDPLLERWAAKTAAPPIKLQHISIEGGHTNLEKEIKQLRIAHKKDPENTRYLFYLAQSYKGVEEYEQAIEWYLKRIEKGGDREEIWFSKFMIGSCYEKLDQWETALRWHLEAYEMNPDRSDPIQHIATHYRLTKKNDLAYLFAKHGSHVIRSLDQLLFSYPPLRDYQFDEEISIAAYYTRFKDEGFSAASDLMFRKNIPWWIRDQNGRNIFFYNNLLKTTQFYPLVIDLPSIEQELTEPYHLMNSSIVKTDTGYKLICRAVNYTQTGGKVFHTPDAKGIFRSKNFFVLLDQDFNILSQQEIVEHLPRKKFPPCSVEGLEDCRLFEYQGSDWFSCTTNDTNPTGNRQISLCKLSDHRSHPTIQVERLIPLLGPDLYRCEKNWLPFLRDNQLQFIYSYEPLTILAPNLETGECKAHLSQASRFDFSRLKGSAAPISFDDGYLLLIHEIVHYPDHTRAYLHRFLYLDRQFQIKKISRPFVFLRQGIERCRSMTIDHSGTQLLLPISLEDREAHLCSISLEEVRSLLHHFPTADADAF